MYKLINRCARRNFNNLFDDVTFLFAVSFCAMAFKWWRDGIRHFPQKLLTVHICMWFVGIFILSPCNHLCWLITLWVRYVFGIRNVNLFIVCGLFVNETITKDRLSNTEMNQFHSKWCVLYSGFSYIIIVGDVHFSPPNKDCRNQMHVGAPLLRRLTLGRHLILQISLQTLTVLETRYSLLLPPIFHMWRRQLN